MPLPKALRDLIAGKLKEGESLPAELESGVFFEDEGAFLAAADKKSRSKVTEAEKNAEKRAREARETALNEIFEKLGVTDPEQLEEIKGKLADAEGTRDRAAKLEADLNKLSKESKKALDALTKERDELLGFKTTHVKRSALSPHLAKIHPDFRDIVEENLLGKLAIDGEKITAPEGKEIAAYVDEIIKAKPSLKAPDFQRGAGTGPNGGKAQGDSGGNAGASNGQQKDPPKDVRTAVVQALAEKAAAAGGAAGP